MKLFKKLTTRQGRTKSAAKGLLLSASIALIASIIALQPSMHAYASTNPGLDSGNAQVTTVGSDTVLSYKTTGSSTFKAPAGVTNVRVLVVGGGGGGGAGELINQGDGGGGGGAGEYLHQTSFAVTPGQPLTVTVGGGGAGSTTKQNDGGTTAQNGAGGSNSIFGSLTARGGGGGGGNDQTGLNGGSGGGAGGHCTNSGTNTPGGTATAVAPGVGNNGGNSPQGSCTPRGAAGGGGAAAVGATGSGSNGGAGAAGLQTDITGTNTFYAAGGGGGGGSSSGTGANGGSSIGGKGGNASGGIGAVGATNTGAGGGGGGSSTSTSGGNGGNGGSGIVIVRFTTQNIPDQLGMTGLRMWYKADGTGNTNALWKDSSGLGFDITQGTASKQPVLTQGAINFNPAYVFDGNDDAFSMPTHGILGSDPMTAFYGATATRTDGGYRYFEEFGDDTPSIEMNNGKPELYVRGTTPTVLSFPTIEALVPHVYSFVSPNANNQSRIVGVDDNEQSQNVTTGTYTTTSGSQTGNTFGRTNGSSGTSWAGPIAEALYFNRVLTPAERLKVASYLAVKYGVTRYQGTSGAGYSDSGGTTIWSADSTYKNNIAGIGRDDTMTLNQKQSKSTSDGDIVTVGHGGTIATTNQGNTNNFGADKSFLLWGHNGAATNQSTTVTGAYIRMNRIWKAVRTNSVSQVKVQIPTSSVTAISGNSGILYTSSSATFDASSTRTNMTVNGSNYEATVTLPAGTSYFTFGSMAGSDIQFVSKTATDIGGTTLTSYTPGEPIEYRLTVKNNGPDNAGTVTVTDTLPAGIVPTSGQSSGGGWSCNVSGQTVTCTRPALNTGATAPDITIEATIASNITGTKNNTATASVSNDPDTSNNSASLSLPAAPKADLSIAKGHSGIPTAGQPHTYTFTVRNNGPSDVASFTITDTLDSNLTYSSSSPNICSASGQNITCSGGALTNGQTTTFTMTVDVSQSYGGGTINNTGIVAVPAGTTDPNSSNNSSTDASNVLVTTDLGIAKAHTGNFTAGVNNDFTITVDNQGPSAAPIGAVTVTDTLDGDFSFVSASGTGWSCSESSGTVTCNNTAVINAGGPAPVITLRVLVDPIAKGSTTNTAEVSSTTPDPDSADNITTDTVTIVSEADLGITKAHVGTAFTAGQQEQYTFTVVNNGPSVDSPTYQITDTLPASLSFVSASGAAACSAAGQVVTCNGGAIAVGDTQVTTVTVAVNGSATGTIANTATVAPAAGVTDPVSGNNSSSDNVNVEPNADLTVVSKTPNTNMTAGANASYVVKVHNNGPSNVSSFKVTDTLDSNLTFQTSSGCSVTSTTGDGRQVVECTGGAVNSGQDAADITINVTVESTVTPGSTISNTATVSPPAGVNDPDTSNNSGSVNRTIVASADLAVTKSHTGDFTAGSNSETYTIVVTNNGPSDATTFTVTDVLPTGLTFVSGSSTAGINATCANAGQTVTCTGGPSIGAGQTSTITLTVAVDSDLAGNTTLDNTASVASATTDPDTSNNTTPTDTVTIDSVADLQIEKAHVNDFTAGNTEQYYIDVINNGPSDVTGFTVTDTLPAGLTYNTSNLNGSDICAGSSGQNVTCNGPAVASGQSVTFILTVNTSGALVAGTVINNTATVATIAPTTDPNSANNSSTDSATVVNVTDLSIVKTHTGTFTAGDDATYTMTVSNGGPSNTPTNDVQVVDTLPTGMTFVPTGSGGTGWTCNELNGTVTCDYAPVLAVSGTTPTLTINVSIDPTMQGQVSNTATVVSRLDDSDPADDNSTDTTTIAAEANLTATKTAQGALTAGEPVTYRFSVTNSGGPSTANNVKITDNLQGHFTYLSFNSVSGGTWSCADASGTVTCTLPSLTVGATAVVDVTLDVAEDAPDPVQNTAAVTFDGTDPSAANPSATDPVAHSADLEVDITHEQKTYRGGDTVNFTFTVKNHGPSAATNAVMTGNFPSDLAVKHVSATAPGGDSILASLDRLFFPRASAAANPFTCNLNGQQLVCNASTLFVGTYPLYVTAQINNNFTGQLITTASITSATPDPNPNDTTATDVITGVLQNLGLVGTGMNLLPWILGGSVLVGGSAFFWLRLRRGRLVR